MEGQAEDPAFGRRKEMTDEPTNSGAREARQAEKDLGFPVVGVGASAGGLEAFEQFFKDMPDETGAAFVLIQHLATEHRSMLSQLVQNFTRLPVAEAKDGVMIEPDHIYVIPSGVQMAIEKGALKLSPPPEHAGARMPIDFFFRSLAEERGDQAIGVILSGTGTDGTIGLRVINGAGGMTMVQEATDAHFSGMPESAIHSGQADYVLPAREMGGQLMKLFERVRPKGRKEGAPPQDVGTVLARLLSLVRSRTGHDFSLYRRNTVQRRIERRMKVHNLFDPGAYLAYAETHASEVDALFKELLIRVTSFFRDPDTFAELKTTILPTLLSGKPEGYNVRVWVPGCSTGEEAYSIAIVLQEYIYEAKRACKLQIFATDIDAESIDQARGGLYPPNIGIDVSHERLQRFFVQEGQSYRVKKDLRESVVFALQDVIKDPPFRRLDLLSCRNLLIYLQNELQKRMMPLFHYSLNPGGVLFLGSAESIGTYDDLFETVGRKWKLFRARPVAGHGVLDEALFLSYEGARKTGEVRERLPGLKVGDLVQRYLLDHFAPPSVVIDEKGRIVFIHGQTGKYLELQPGEPRLNLFDMAREDTRTDVRMAVTKALTQKKEVVQESVEAKGPGRAKGLTITARPMGEPGMEGLVLVTFAETRAAGEQHREKRPLKAGRSSRMKEMEEDLSRTKESLQATIEELQSANEELKSTNEELQSANEELQSTNEELETSREEIQSVNEELVTVNSELRSKIDEVSRTEADTRNLFDAIDVGMVFLDPSLTVKRFTPRATKLVKLIPADVGRPFSDITRNFKYDDLLGDVRATLAAGRRKEARVQTDKGESYSMRIIPYLDEERMVQGVVLTFTEAGNCRP